MGKASSSSSATTAIDASGGNLTINQPNWVMWAVIGLALVLSVYLYVNRKH